MNERGYPERDRGPNGEQITVCDRNQCHPNYEISRILGTRKGYVWQWNDDGQREYLVSMKNYPTIEWLKDNEVSGGKKALLHRFKKDMGWASLSSQVGDEFCVPANRKPKKHPCKEHTVGPNGESIRVDDTLKGDASNIERILGTRTGFRDDGKRQWLVKLCGRKEGLVWILDNNLTKARDKWVAQFKRDAGHDTLPSRKGNEFLVPGFKGAEQPKQCSSLNFLDDSESGEDNQTLEDDLQSDAHEAPSLDLHEDDVQSHDGSVIVLDQPQENAVEEQQPASNNSGPAAPKQPRTNTKRTTLTRVTVGSSTRTANQSSASPAATSQADKRKHVAKGADDSQDDVKKPRTEDDDAKSRRMFELARNMHDFNIPEDRRISNFIEYLVSMKYKRTAAEDHQFLRGCLEKIQVDGLKEAWLVNQPNHVPAEKKELVEYYNLVCNEASGIITRHFRELKDHVGQGPSNRTPSVDSLLDNNLLSRIQAYVTKLRNADLPISQALKEAIVWELVSDTLTATVENRARVSQLVREKL
ncbi:hypothetical protein AAVH_10867 [Aphelenchoides avenae]|nr:hypothetical protein AAVH_10867 [Aphelenchus avenae]